jgi:plastocyanin
MTRRQLRALGIVAVLLAAASSAGRGALAETIRVEIKSLAFAPVAITAHVGDTIEWVNDDFVAHSATARNGDWDVMLSPHQTGRTFVKKSGKIEYYCRYHPNMKGEVTIAPE